MTAPRRPAPLPLLLIPWVLHAENPEVTPTGDATGANTPAKPTGLPAISGTPQVEKTLAADTSAIADAERRAALVNAGGGANRAHSREQRRTRWHSTGDNPEPRQRVRIRQRKTPRRTPLRPSCPARQALPGNRTSEVVDGLATD